jgi:hypothetical protein
LQNCKLLLHRLPIYLRLRKINNIRTPLNADENNE